MRPVLNPQADTSPAPAASLAKHWHAAWEGYSIAEAAADAAAITAGDLLPTDPQYASAMARCSTAVKSVEIAMHGVLTAPAPDLAAITTKLELLRAVADRASLDAEAFDPVIADLARLESASR